MAGGVSTLARLQIALGLNSADVERGASQIKGELQGVATQANETKGAMAGLAEGFKAGLGLSTGVAAFTLASDAARAFTGFLSDSIKAAQEEQVSLGRMNAALASNVPAWNGNTAAIQQALDARVSLGFGDDALRDSFTAIVASTHDVSEALAVQNAAMDLARFKNISLQDASTALVTIEAGRARGLNTLGINTSLVTTQAERLAAVEKVAAGQAEAFASTNEGAQARAAAAIERFQEQIGGPLLDALATVANAAADTADALGKVGKAAGDAAQGVHDFVAGVQHDAPRVPILADAIDTVTGAWGRLMTIDNNYMTQARQVGQAQAAAAAQTKELAGSLAVAQGALAAASAGAATLNGVTAGATAAMLASTAAADNLGAGLDALNSSAGQAYETLQGGVEAIGNLNTAADTATTATNNLAGALAALPTTVTVDVIVRQTLENSVSGAGAGAGTSISPIGTPAGNTDFGPTNPSTGSLSGTSADPVQVARDRQRAADETQRKADEARRKAAADAAAAQRKAAQDARDLANAQIEAGRDAFSQIADAAHRYFDDLHQKNLDAIENARQAANAQVDIAKKAADDQIDAQKKVNDAAVSDFEKQIKAKKDARELAQLQADVANAATPEDKIRAQQALQDFVDQQQLDSMRTQADAANAQLDAQKKQQDDAFDAQKAANDKAAADQKDAEDARYKQQVDTFDSNLASLSKYLEKHPAEWKKATDAIVGVLKKAGVDIELEGANNANAYVRGINKVFTGAGIMPLTVTGTGTATTATTSATSVALSVAAGLSPVSSAGGIGDVYLDDQKVGVIVERYLARQGDITRSGVH